MHLNDDRLRAFVTGSLTAAELLEADDHLAGCEACRARLAEHGGPAAMGELVDGIRPPAVHLTDDDVLLFAQGRVPPEQAFALRRHLAECEICQRQIDELSAWTKSPRLRRPAIAAVAAAAVLVICAVSARMWYSQRAVQPAPAAQDVLQSLSSVSRSRIETALRTGTAAEPAFMPDLAPPRETLMGRADAASGFDISGPVGTAVIEDAPVFTWRPLAGAVGYVVTVFDENGAEAARSPALTELRWTPARALPRDHTYTWQVSVEQHGRSQIAPAPPAPPARFRVLDAATAAELQRVAREYPEAHAVLGILYMQAGVRDAAIAEFGSVRSDEPAAGIARQSLARLQASSPHTR